MDAFHLGAGVAAVAFASWQHARLPRIQPKQAPRIRPARAFRYSFWLVAEVLLSAIHVARVILNPKRHLDPRVVRFRSRQPSLSSGVLFANSITLTPGTLTIDLEDDCYTVHALTPVTERDVLDGEMAARAARVTSDEAMPKPEELPFPLEPAPP